MQHTVCAAMAREIGMRELANMVYQCVLLPRKIGELELDFENPTWKSNWDFEECTIKFTVKVMANSITLKKQVLFVFSKIYKITQITTINFIFPFTFLSSFIFLFFPFLPSFCITRNPTLL